MTVLNEIEKLVQRELKYLILLYDTYTFLTTKREKYCDRYALRHFAQILCKNMS
jgi:hypothetical protein